MLPEKHMKHHELILQGPHKRTLHPRKEAKSLRDHIYYKWPESLIFGSMGWGGLGVMLTLPLLYLLFWHQILSSCVFLLVHVLFMLCGSTSLLVSLLGCSVNHILPSCKHIFLWHSPVMPCFCLVVMVTCQDLLKSKPLNKIYRSHCHLPHLLTPHHFPWHLSYCLNFCSHPYKIY